MNISPNPNPVKTIFNTHYSNCYKLLYNSDIELTQKINLELFAVLYVVSDLAAFSAKHNRKAVSDIILHSIFNKLSMVYQKVPVDSLFSRIDFYTSVVGGLDLHAHALMSKDVADVNPVFRCAIAFSDCCLNPDYIEDYNGYCPAFSAIDVFDFTASILEPLNSEFISLFNSVHSCQMCTVPAPIKDSSSTLRSVSPQVSSMPTGTGNQFQRILALIALLIVVSTCIILAVQYFSISQKQPEIGVPSQAAPSLTALPTPDNGKVFISPTQERVAPLTIETPATMVNYFFILTNHGSNKAIMSFFVHGNSTVEIFVPLGNFDIYYASGETWYGTRQLFGASTYRAKLDSTFSFTQESDRIFGWTVQLQPITDGNLDSDPVDADDFPS